MSSVRLFLLMALAMMLLATTACTSGHIRPDSFYPDDPAYRMDENARVPNTPEYHKVLDVLGQYRSSLVSKDFGALNRLVSADYYDNAGTTHTTADDYGRADLAEVFELMARHAETIQYKVTVKDVVISGERAHIDYEYEYAYQYRIGDETTWDAGIEVNRLQMAREGDHWRITSGL